MASDLAGLGLPPAVLQSLNSRSIFTVRDVLQQSATDLMELLSISYTDAEQLLQNVCLNSAPAYITVKIPRHQSSCCNLKMVIFSIPTAFDSVGGPTL